jgi:pilus assembly protein CpaB
MGSLDSVLSLAADLYRLPKNLSFIPLPRLRGEGQGEGYITFLFEERPLQRISPLLLLVLAIFFGGIAAYMANGWLKAKSLRANQAALQKVQVTPTVVAAKDIPAGSSLEPGFLKVVDWPKDNQLPGAAEDIKQVSGRVLRYPLVAGEIVLEGKLAPKGTSAGLAGIIQNDKRAVTVKVDEASGVAGFIMPGNWVDVLLTMEKNEFKDDPMSQVVLQNILVLGRGQDLDQPKNDEKPKIVPTVTLQVTPEEGERLALASKEGFITLALRGYTETAAVPTSGIRTSALMQSAKKPEPTFEAPIAAAPLPKKSGVEVLRGVGRETVNF